MSDVAPQPSKDESCPAEAATGSSAWPAAPSPSERPADGSETPATASNDNGEALLAESVPAPPPPSFLPAVLTRRTAVTRARTRPEAIARKVYFAFDFDDLARVNTIRQTGKIDLRDTIQRGFYDRAVWESRAAKNEAGLMTLLREAVKNSAVVCVLIGTNTWRSRWAKYEIARALIEERGLLAVHINGIEHPSRKAPDPPGLNPLHVMGLYHHETGNYYIVERHEVVRNAEAGEIGFAWQLYEDHSDPVPVPRYITGIHPGRVAPLSRFTCERDFMTNDGPASIASWIDAAVAQVGR